MVTLVKVIVHYGVPITGITRKAKEEINVTKGSTVLTLLKNLAAKYGDGFKDYVFSNFERNQVSKGIIVSLNAKNVSAEIENITIENDVYMGIISPVGGG